MSRTAFYKLAYAGTVLGVVALAGSVVANFGGAGRTPVWAVALMVVLLLLPGRVQGALWRDFFRGRRLLAHREHAASIPYFERFLARVRARPALKRAIWLSWGMYSRDIEAMTENNLGVAKLELGRWDEAEEHLKRAIAIDRAAPLPHYNLAMIFAARGMGPEAAQHLARAGELGYRDTTSDRLTRAAGELLARIEGRPLGPTGRTDN